MALLGVDTGDPASFTDHRARDPSLIAMRDRVTFTPDRSLPTTVAFVTVRARGTEHTADADTGRPASDLGAQWQKLSSKFLGLVAPVIGAGCAHQLHAAIASIDDAASVGSLFALARAGMT
jgi:hypothetical protein